MLERSTLRSLGLLALFYGSPVLAGSESAATDKVESIETSVCRLIESSARTQNLPVAFLTRLIWQESSFRPNVISPAGAQGIAQFMPKTADERGLAKPFGTNPMTFRPSEFIAVPGISLATSCCGLRKRLCGQHQGRSRRRRSLPPSYRRRKCPPVIRHSRNSLRSGCLPCCGGLRSAGQR